MESSISINSRIQKKQVEFQWKIENWNLISRKKKGKLNSKPFYLFDSEMVCHMILDITNNSLVINTLIKRTPIAELESDMSICIDMSDFEGPRLNVKLSQESIVYDRYNRGSINYNFKLPENIHTDYLEAHDDSLIFKCVATFYYDKHTVRYSVNAVNNEQIVRKNIQEEYPYDKKQTFNNYGTLYEKKIMCDVTIVIGEEKLKAHSVILAMVSPYFLAMFSHQDLKESTERIVDLSNDADVTAEVYQGFLDYVYGLKTVKDLKSIATELLVLADKYDMQDLKGACEAYLCDYLNKDNVSKLLFFSHKYNCKQLLKQTLDLAKDNMDLIKKSSEFDKIFQDKDLMLLLL